MSKYFKFMRAEAAWQANLVEMKTGHNKNQSPTLTNNTLAWMESVNNVRIDSSRNYSNAATNLYQSATNIDRGIWGLVDCSRVEEGRSGQTALRTTNVSTNKRVKVANNPGVSQNSQICSLEQSNSWVQVHIYFDSLWMLEVRTGRIEGHKNILLMATVLTPIAFGTNIVEGSKDKKVLGRPEVSPVCEVRCPLILWCVQTPKFQNIHCWLWVNNLGGRTERKFNWNLESGRHNSVW